MRLLLPLVFLCLAMPTNVLAQHGRQGIVEELDLTTGQLAEGGVVTDSSVFRGNELVGMLAEATSSYVEVWLEEGKEYFFSAACSDACGELDLRLLTVESTVPLAEDLGNNTYPLITVRAPRSGPYLLAVDLRSCREDLCYYGVRTFRR